jgi:hypothetical protein
MGKADETLLITKALRTISVPETYKPCLSVDASSKDADFLQLALQKYIHQIVNQDTK